MSKSEQSQKPVREEHEDNTGAVDKADSSPKEVGGRDGLEPTRYGDWEKNGRCIDF